MKKSIKLGVVAAALMAVAGFAFAQTKDIKVVDPRESPYVLSPQGTIVMDPFGLCWRTAFWSVERAAATKIEGAKFPNWTAGCECDKELMKAPTCEPPPPPPPRSQRRPPASPKAPRASFLSPRRGGGEGERAKAA